MRKLTAIAISTLFISLGACSWLSPYQPNIQQGNLLSGKMLSQVRVGMSKEQVVDALGYPILEQPFSNNHWAYVYTMQVDGGPITKKNLDLYFQNNHLVKIGGDYPPL